jgi:hypothetical protein
MAAQVLTVPILLFPVQASRIKQLAAKAETDVAKYQPQEITAIQPAEAAAMVVILGRLALDSQLLNITEIIKPEAVAEMVQVMPTYSTHCIVIPLE